MRGEFAHISLCTMSFTNQLDCWHSASQTNILARPEVTCYDMDPKVFKIIVLLVRTPSYQQLIKEGLHEGLIRKQCALSFFLVLFVCCPSFCFICARSSRIHA